MTKIFLDVEFTGLHQNTTLISIGLISDCGKTFYAEFTDYNKNQIDDWIKENIIKNLKFIDDFQVRGFPNHVEIKNNSLHIKGNLHIWLQQFKYIEMWGDCLAYDWVLFCELFGGALKIPKHICYIPFDICTLFKIKGIYPDINREEFANGEQFFEGKIEKHNALWDAKVIKMCYDRLIVY